VRSCPHRRHASNRSSPGSDAGSAAGQPLDPAQLTVAEWLSPDVGVTVDEVADTYASFAIKLLG
jgi:hypothetical protein